MRKNVFIPIIAGFVLFFSTTSFSNVSSDITTKEGNELIDIVYEYNMESSVVQVGDFVIDGIDTVFIDQGKGKVFQSSKKKISVGILVKVDLIGSDENGVWRAKKITIYSGDGLEEVLQSFSEEKRKQLLAVMESFTDSEKTDQKPKMHQEDLHLENGVWVN